MRNQCAGPCGKNSIFKRDGSGVDLVFCVLKFWALLSSDALRRLPVLPGVDRLIILVDNDDIGVTAATGCAARWKMTRTVVELTRDQQGADFNDVVIMFESGDVA
jgi:hypothetical protein